MTQAAYLALEDGHIFEGIAVGALGTTVGELVFNTAMTGYQEILSDPSYACQIINFTMPHIGNTGVNKQDMESARIWAAGLVLRHYPKTYSHYRAEQSLQEWLLAHDIIGIAGIDTRALTSRIRASGSLVACITTDFTKLDEALALARDFSRAKGQTLTSVLSADTKKSWPSDLTGAGHHVVVYDFGVKQGILKQLLDMGCRLTFLSSHAPVADCLALKPNGVVLSNGPGDPSLYVEAIKVVRSLLEHSVPILGICLGFQILGLACHAQIKKMKFGHHGANHPVIAQNEPHRIMISSQNHNFMLDETFWPDDLEVTHRSLFDGSVQGIRHCTKPAIGFQGHPEASPGPHDMSYIFRHFLALMHAQSECILKDKMN